MSSNHGCLTDDMDIAVCKGGGDFSYRMDYVLKTGISWERMVKTCNG